MTQSRSSTLRLAAFLLIGSLTLNLQTITEALENGLARTPPMGWLAWERFTCQVDCKRYPNECISTRLFMQMSERIVADNWLALGYDHMNIDDCWSELQRDPETKRLVPDRDRFKEGIKSIADKVHSHPGLKLGIYGDCGTLTCGGYPGQLMSNSTQEEDDYRTSTYFKLDADIFAEWHVDSLKFDGCYVDPIKAERICSRMADALAETKRPIMLVCEWPFYMMYAHAEPDYELAAASCNVWRYYDDIEDSWLSIQNTIDHTIRHQSTMLKYHGPGHWFDPDQLVIGNFGLSVAQARAQMAIWCIWAAPLYMSNDLRNIRPEFVEILQNRHLIAVNQDKLGVLGQMVKQEQQQFGVQQAFVKPILPVKNNCPSFAIVVLNRATLGNKQKVSFKLADLLLGAPIKQAARNQARVIEYERTIAQAKAKTEAAQDEVFEASEMSPGDVAQDEPFKDAFEHEQEIDSAECVKRLMRAARLNDVDEQADANLSDDDYEEEEPPGVKFEVFDLFDNAKSLGTLALDDSLELLVEPNSVRALKLIEQ